MTFIRYRPKIDQLPIFSHVPPCFSLLAGAIVLDDFRRSQGAIVDPQRVDGDAGQVCYDRARAGNITDLGIESSPAELATRAAVAYAAVNQDRYQIRAPSTTKAMWCR